MTESEENWHRCGVCGEKYYPGEPTGELFIAYPEGESRYWRHTRTSDRHLAINDLKAIEIPRMLKALPGALANAKRAQKDLENPTYQALKRIIA